MQSLPVGQVESDLLWPNNLQVKGQISAFLRGMRENWRKRNRKCNPGRFVKAKKSPHTLLRYSRLCRTEPRAEQLAFRQRISGPGHQLGWGDLSGVFSGFGTQHLPVADGHQLFRHPSCLQIHRPRVINRGYGRSSISHLKPDSSGSLAIQVNPHPSLLCAASRMRCVRN